MRRVIPLVIIFIGGVWLAILTESLFVPLPISLVALGFWLSGYAAAIAQIEEELVEVTKEDAK